MAEGDFSPLPLGTTGPAPVQMIPPVGPGLGLLPEAAAQIAAGTGQGTLGLVKFPGDVASGRYSLDQISRLAPQEALGLAALGMGIPKPPGSLGIFGGEGATLGSHPFSHAAFDHGTDSLTEAKNLEEEMINSPSHVADIESPTPEEHYAIGKKIFEQTGWYRGADSKWRFVIPDEDAAFEEGGVRDLNEYHRAQFREQWGIDPGNNYSVYEINPGDYGIPNGEIHRLEGVLDHPDLYEAYPFLKDYKVQTIFPAGRGLRGEFDPNTKTIRIAPGQPVDVMSTLLHEVQHAVQEHEGFARGGSTSEFRQEGMKPEAAFNAYQRLAGEVEARHVQRLYEGGYSGHYPPESEHWIVPRSQQILRFFNPVQYRLEPVEGDPFNAQAGNGTPGGGQGGP